MKTLLDKDGNFMFTFEGEDIDVSSDEYIDCTIVEGDDALQTIDQEMEQADMDFANADNDEHEAEILDLKQRLEVLEQKVADLENGN